MAANAAQDLHDQYMQEWCKVRYSYKTSELRPLASRDRTDTGLRHFFIDNNEDEELLFSGMSTDVSEKYIQARRTSRTVQNQEASSE